jgi:hypothetical protein
MIISIRISSKMFAKLLLVIALLVAVFTMATEAFYGKKLK